MLKYDTFSRTLCNKIQTVAHKTQRIAARTKLNRKKCEKCTSQPNLHINLSNLAEQSEMSAVVVAAAVEPFLVLSELFRILCA